MRRVRAGEAVRSRTLISIVDDDQSIREAMARLMKTYGYLEQTFDSGAQLQSSNYCARTDCLIADVQRPDMTGLELHGRLVAAGMPIPTILITAPPAEHDFAVVALWIAHRAVLWVTCYSRTRCICHAYYNNAAGHNPDISNE